MYRTAFKATILAAATAIIGMVQIASVAHAGAPLSEYSCRELWLERNGIYANNGYCFTAPGAIKIFGKRCHAPYGKLNASERRTVERLKLWERRKGCTAA